MGTIRALVLISVAALMALPYARTATAQTASQATSAAGACEVAGTFKTTATDRGLTSVWDGTLRYVHDGTPGVDSYVLKGGQVRWAASGNLGECTFSGGPITFPAIMDSTRDGGNLIIFPDGSYLASAANFTILPDLVVTMTCPDYSVTMPNASWSFQTPSNPFARVSDDGRTLGGTWTIVTPVGGVTHEWHFTKSDADPRLVVEIEGYDDWRPKAGKDEKDPGNELTIKARLQRADGSPPCGSVDTFRFELTKASREPGIALNFPPKGEATDDYDLQFASPTQGSTQGPFGQYIEVPPGSSGAEAQAVLSAFDWGAWGTLKVTAKLPDGSEIVGHLEGDESRTEILIPKRQEDSFIADKWKEDPINKATGLADNDDSENDPVGDGHKGDGLTLYEEYRGFRIRGKHVSGLPQKKDFFVHNGAGVNMWPGVRHFARITGLNVHYRLQDDEFDIDSTSATFRRINFNHAEGPHEVDQHGIYIRKFDPQLEASEVSDLGPPKHVRYVDFSVKPGEISSVRRGSRIITRDVGVATVAHELGHSIRIYHHGSADDYRIWTFKRDPADSTRLYRRPGDRRLVVLENGIEVDVRDEDDVPNPLSGNFWVGVWGGQHSGVEDCVMRYDNSIAYIPGPGRSSTIRYWADGGEVVGMGLCDRATGTGVNAQGRTPRPRYGGASQLESNGPARRGNCKAQLCVSDRYH